MGRRLTVPAAPPRARRSVAVVAVAGALVALLLVPALVAAHPLGNFTINHYAGLRIEPGRVLLDVVIDEAEIAAFQARQAFDIDGDGSLSDEEIEAARTTECDTLAPDLLLTADGTELPLRTIEAGLSFPPGVGGLSTMRMVCGFEAALPQPIGASPIRIAFNDDSYPNRLGWRETVATGSGVTLVAVEGQLRVESISRRLTAYPPELVPTPLADLRLVVDATKGGPELAPFDIPDAEPVGVASSSEPPGSSVSPGASASGSPALSSPPSPTSSPPVGAVPGGVGGGELPEIFRQDLTPLVLLLSVLTAAVLGAGHAITPGHGKTLMAAYLVGTRGTRLHAVGLALSVSVSHTVGILVLAAIVLGASDVLPPDVVVRWAPVVAALSIVAIGGWMLFGEIRRRWLARSPWTGRATTPPHTHAHDELAEHAEHGHDHANDNGHGHDGGRVAALVEDHDHAIEHSHGGLAHSHAPRPGSTITWRSLFALGLAGGLIPSTSALLILLGSIAAGRPAFGFVLVVAFGLGMAAVMGGIGLALVAARDRLDRLPSAAGLGRISEAVPLVAAVIVFGFGVYLTVQAVMASPVL